MVSIDRIRVIAAAVSAGALVGVGAVAAAAQAGGTHARTARTISLNESGHLHLTSKHGFTLNEMGSASGTIDGTIYLHLNVVDLNRVTAEVNIYPNGGSVTGDAKASYQVAGATASFSGTMSISRGTGSYNGAHASNLRFSGTVARSNDAVNVHLSGEMSS
jgi:hypothetical protein